MTPTPRERQFLRAVAAANPSSRNEWWSAFDLQHTTLFPDFRNATALQIAGLGKSTARKGMAETRWIGTRGHGWAEWRIRSFGRGLVSDSCIGGGLAWKRTPDGPACPACLARAIDLGVFPPFGEIPAHPLSGHEPAATQER